MPEHVKQYLSKTVTQIRLKYIDLRTQHSSRHREVKKFYGKPEMCKIIMKNCNYAACTITPKTCQTLFFENGHSDSNKTYRSLHSAISSIQWNKKVLPKAGNVENNYEKQLRSSLGHTLTCPSLLFSTALSTSQKAFIPIENILLDTVIA